MDNLLDMSRLQAGALAVFPRPAGLEEIVARALDDLGPAGRRSWWTSRTRCPRSGWIPAILERVIVNLTTNAIRYSPAGQPPLLTASALGDRVELRVADRGPGIPEPDRDRVFVPFQRLGDTDNTTGVGLGLALSRGLTEAMGGTLEPEETPGGGLTMVLSLPAAPVPTTPAGRPRQRERAATAACPRRHPRPPPRVAGWPRDPGPGRRRRAADPARAADQPAGARIRGGHGRHRRAGAGEAGHHPPDLVILDLGLPDLDGVEVIGGLRGWTSAPIIVLSGRADSTDKVEALDAGADDYVTKPFGMDELLARMRAAARRGRAGRGAAAGEAGRPGRRPGGQARHQARTAPTSGSPRPSGICWRSCSGTRAS